MPSAPIRALATSCCRVSPWRCTTVSPRACFVTSSNWQPSRSSTSGVTSTCASNAACPPMPAPATKMVRDTATDYSGDLVLQHALGRAGLARLQVGGKAVQRRAIGTDDLVVVAEIEKHVRMIERGIGAHAHEF